MQCTIIEDFKTDAFTFCRGSCLRLDRSKSFAKLLSDHFQIPYTAYSMFYADPLLYRYFAKEAKVNTKMAPPFRHICIVSQPEQL